jgi:hypothetical protein
LHKIRPKGKGKGEGKSQGRAALSEDQKKQANQEKKAAKMLRKKEEKAANPPGEPTKAKAKGKAQGRVAAGIAPEDLVEGDTWEDEHTIYTFVEPEMEYENDEWFYDHDTQKWWGAYVNDDDEQPYGGSPCSR